MNATQTVSSNPRRTRRRWHGPLWAVGALLVVLASRFVTSDLVIHSTVTQRSCENGFCVERMKAPDLLLVPGRREVHLRPDVNNMDLGRYYVAQDPFSEYSDVKIEWSNGGVSLSDGAAVLTWDADTIGRLDD
jgi:hypothetical protein